jgi:hypothetical protein
MGVEFDRILDGFDGPFEELQPPILPPAARVRDPADAVGFFLGCRTNDSFRAVNRLLKAGEEVRRLQEPFTVRGATHPAGMFFVTRKATTLPLLERLAAELGTPFAGSPEAPGRQALTLKPVRVGLWDRYGGSMPSGWTRWLLERFEFPYQVVYAPELDKGGLRDKYDVLVFMDDALPGRGGNRPPEGDETGGEVQPLPRDQPPPDEYRDRRGSITKATTAPQLKKFLADGGTVLAIGNATGLANMLELPLANHLVTQDKDGKDVPLPREKFYVPPSVLRVRVDPAQPLAWGMGEQVDVMFANSPTFRLAEGADKAGWRRVAWFEGKTPLRSGWALGQEHLDGGVAIAEAKVGKGRLVVYGPQILFRAQPHGDFKLFFNGISQAAVKD